MNVHALPDLKALDAKAALEAVTARARKLEVFGPGVHFDEPVWDLSDAKRARPSAAQTSRLYFTRLGARETRSMEGREAFRANFGNLVKSLVVLREFLNPADAPDIYKKIVQSAKYLHEALADHEFDPASLTSEDFTTAACAPAGLRPVTMEAHGERLEEIAAFINKHGLSRLQIHFKKGKFRERLRNRTSAKAQTVNKDKMPSEEVIDAVIAMSNEIRNKGDDLDVLRASVIELLMCAPWRINELLNALFECLRVDQKTDPQSGERSPAYGIHHEGSKGADDTVKWFPSAMVDVGLRALADIRRITQPARDVAKWMENNPGRAYLAEQWRLADPETLLTMEDAAQTLGLASRQASTYWLASRKVPRFERDGRFWCRLADLEAAILASQPKLPPGSPPLSEYLFLVPDHFFRDDLPTVWCILDVISISQIHCFLSTAGKHKSVFERLGIVDENGNPYRVNTHAFRHYLNTIAQEGLLPQLDIARWSGRKRVEQNAAYDHTGGLHLGRYLQSTFGTEAMNGPIVATLQALPPAERESFLKARFNTAHMTDIGACAQDWSMAPCPSHGACGSCGEHMVIKGNATQKARAERLLAEHENMLSQAKLEMDEGTYGANQWVTHNTKMVEGLRKTIAVHQDEKIANGTIVQPGEI
jgi:hypothetical protein